MIVAVQNAVCSSNAQVGWLARHCLHNCAVPPNYVSSTKEDNAVDDGRVRREAPFLCSLHNFSQPSRIHRLRHRPACRGSDANCGKQTRGRKRGGHGTMNKTCFNSIDATPLLQKKKKIEVSGRRLPGLQKFLWFSYQRMRSWPMVRLYLK